MDIKITEKSITKNQLNKKNTPQTSITDNKKEIKGLIIAEYYKDEDDVYSDYFYSRAIKTIYLGVTYSERNSAKELKKFALKFKEIENIIENFTINKDISYCSLPSFFFGETYKEGWKIHKHCGLDLKSEKYQEIIKKLTN